MIGKYVFLAMGLAIVAGCGLQPSRDRSASPTVSFAETYAAAEAALAKAAASRNVWSKTEGLLQQSKIANDEGRKEDAIQLANEARMQAELALTQAISQEKDWQENVLF
ncbi:MAG: hypothetical protein GXP15_03625 [Gammaproteobacteria bacterium]|nr:hypothetical protein [Gammaproteobacteria bacterium]